MDRLCLGLTIGTAAFVLICAVALLAMNQMSAAPRLRNSTVALNEGAANEIAKVAQAAEASRMLSDEAKKCDDDDDDVAGDETGFLTSLEHVAEVLSPELSLDERQDRNLEESIGGCIAKIACGGGLDCSGISSSPDCTFQVKTDDKHMRGRNKLSRLPWT
ncbi:unnamed protein product [Aphanomyces euteiches]